MLTLCIRLVNGTLWTVEDVVIIVQGVAISSGRPHVGTRLHGTNTWRTEPREGHPGGLPIVPIAAMKVSFKHKGGTGLRTQLPLAWAMTVHKARGLTLSRMRLGLGEVEFANGLTFVALSRVRNLQSLCLAEPVDFKRVKQFSGARYEARLRDLARRYAA